jgi:hypothetical protein
LQFELDNLNLHGVEYILLSGEPAPDGLIEYFSLQIPGATVKTLKIHSVGLSDLKHSEIETLGIYYPALGAALRSLDLSMNCRFRVDLTPPRVRDSQNRLSLSLTGWALLVLMPILAFGIAFQAGRSNWELRREQARLTPLAAQIAATDAIDTEIAQAQSRLNAYEKADALLDSLQVGKVSFGACLGKMMQVCERYDGSWFTELTSNDDGKMQMVGYSLNRATIPSFVRDLHAEISKVETQEIRAHPVYRFELVADPRGD